MSKIPSICMIPSGYKANKVYSVLPTNGDADLATTRASTATRVNEIGLIEEVASNVPRLDYSDGGCPAQLLEPESRNLFTHSEDFSTYLVSPTQTTNSTVGINGISVNSYYGTTTSSTITVLTDTYYTVSIYAKKNNWGFIQIRTSNFDAGSNARTWFDLENGIVGSTDTPANHINQTIKSFGNGWYRCSITFKSVTDLNGNVTFSVNESDTSLINGSSSSEDLFFDAAQLEEQSYATSYIPTSGATATRVAETLSKTGLSNYINSSEGVFYFEGSFLSNSDTSLIELNDNSSNNRVSIYTESGLLNANCFNGVSNTISFAGNPTENNKLAIKYSINDLRFFINGTLVGTDNTFSGFTSDLSAIYFSLSSGLIPFRGKLKDLRVYNEALTDAELQKLTS